MSVHIPDELELGYTLEEVAALHGLDLDELKQEYESDPDTQKAWDRARIVALSDKIELGWKNLTNPKFNAATYALLMANRFGWTIKPTRLVSRKKLKDADALAQSIKDGEIDADIGIQAIKALGLAGDIKRNTKFIPLLELMEKIYGNSGATSTSAD